MQQVNLGMIGGGTVGSGVFHALQRNGDLMASRIGAKINVRKIAVKAFDEPRPYAIPTSYMTTDWQTVVNDPEVHIVTELVGGITLARTITLAALKLGKPVISANKALISAHGEELFAAAKENKTNLYYEASVCGGIPIIKALREGFVGNRITHLYGIVNGTCNYILTRMKLEGADFESVLKDAQVLANVNHVFNAVFVRGDVVGDTLFYGRGAGKDATASAVLSDLADAALDLKFGTGQRVPAFVPHERKGAVAPIDEVMSRYFI